MKPCCLPAKEYFLSLIIFLSPVLYGQQLLIGPQSNMVLNGDVSLVMNNAALKNNGTFTAGTSTVNFSGHHDTLKSYISGSSTTVFNNLSVSKTAYGLALKSPVVIKNVLALNDGNLYTDSNLTLRSNQQLTARVAAAAAGSAILGKTNVERYIPARRAWRLLTAPVTHSNTIFTSWQNSGVYTPGSGLIITGPSPGGSAGNGLDVSGQNNVSMKRFNYSTQQFISILNTKVAVSPGSNGTADNTGYLIFVRGDRNPANTAPGVVNITTITSIGSLQIGTQTFMASADTSKKYTLIGNPYASPVDFNLLTRVNLKKRFYAWDPLLNTLGGYVMLDDLDNDGVYTKSIPGSGQTKVIQSGQAFFVQTIANAPASITFNESNKSGNSSNLMFRPATPAGMGTGYIVATLNLLNADSSTILADGVIAEFDDMYSAGVDLDDAAKFFNTNENISIVKNNLLLTAERRPAVSYNDTLYLRLNTTTKRNYQFVFEIKGLAQPGMLGYLEDSYLGTGRVVDLEGITKIIFSINTDAASTAVNRFKIVFKPAPVVLPVTIRSVNALQNNNGIAVEWKVENELNMLKYEVEKSADGLIFSLGNTMAAGNPNTLNIYNWLDVNPAPGDNFYRIKCYSINGEIKYSAVVKISTRISKSSFSIYLNPVTGNTITMQMSNHPAGIYQFELLDAAGRVFFIKSIEILAGNSLQKINTGAKLPPGVYQLKFTGQNNIINTQKIMVQ